MISLSERPFFSICIPAYNASEVIFNCLESINAQSFCNWEIIIVDDGSSDSTWECLSMQKIVPQEKITIYCLENNQGPFYARRIAFSFAKGEYIICLDADDEFVDQNCLSRIHSVAAKKQTDMILFNGVIEDRSNNKWLDYKSVGFDSGYLDRDDVVRVFLTTPLLNNLCSKAIRTKLLNSSGLDNAMGFKMCEDRLEVSYALHRSVSFYLLDSPIYYYKMNSASTTHSYFDCDYCKQQSKVESSIVSMFSPKGDILLGQYRLFLNLWADDMSRLNRGRSISELMRCFLGMSQNALFCESYSTAGLRAIRVDRAISLWLLGHGSIFAAAVWVRILCIIKKVIKG